jgi:uncharacterized protein (DUF1810 family)
MDELKKGRKRGHWIWYVFPQPPFGKSARSQFFAIRSRREAEAYLFQRQLGARAIMSAKILMASPAVTVEELMPGFMAVDREKLHSSMTLFYHVAFDLRYHLHGWECFKSVLDRYYDGKEHEQTVRFLKEEEEAATAENEAQKTAKKVAEKEAEEETEKHT